MLAEPVVPYRNLSEAIVSDHEGAGLSFAEVFQADSRNCFPAELPAGCDAAMTGNHPGLASIRIGMLKPKVLNSRRLAELPRAAYAGFGD